MGVVAARCRLLISLSKLQHDGTVLALMYALGVGNDQLVPYAACLIMELYLSGNSTTAKVGDSRISRSLYTDAC